jgi:predicted phage terminase large subunit-like protein
MYRKKATFDELMNDVPAFGFRNNAQTWLIENRGTGSSLIQVLGGRGTNVIPISPQKIGSKEFRFELAVPIMEAKRVWIPKKEKQPWVSVFLHEVMTFPGEYMDIADAFSQALNHYGHLNMRRGMVKLGAYA